MSTPVFSNATRMREAIAYAEQCPDHVNVSKDYTVTSGIERSLFGDVVVVGRKATLSDRYPQTICCNTFVSLGKIAHKSLQIFAEDILLINKVEFTENNLFCASKSFSVLCCTLEGKNTLRVVAPRTWIPTTVEIRHEICYQYQTYYALLNGVIHPLVSEIPVAWHEDSVDAALRKVKDQIILDKAME